MSNYFCLQQVKPNRHCAQQPAAADESSVLISRWEAESSFQGCRGSKMGIDETVHWDALSQFDVIVSVRHTL